MENSGKLKKICFSPAVFYLVPFLSLGSYLLSLIAGGTLHSVDGYYLIHYLYTYDHGFVARGLVGEIISRFYDTVTPEVTKAVVIIFSVSLLVSASLCIGKALTKVKDDRERFLWVLTLVIVLCVMPVSFRTYFIDTKLDKMLWALTLFAVYLSDSKIGIWAAPVLCVIATLINPVFLFCSMILIAIVLLQKFTDSKFSAKNGVICGIAYIAMIAIGLYGSISEKWLGFKTPDELIQYYFSRNAGGLPEEYERFATEWLFDYFEPLKNVFRLAYEIYFVRWGNGVADIFNFVLIAIPAYAVLTVFWIKTIKKEENKFQKFIFFLCAVSPVILILPIAISWESSKYFSNNIIVQLCLIIYYIVNKNQTVLTVLSEAKSFFKKHLILTAAGILYLAMFLY